MSFKTTEVRPWTEGGGAGAAGGKFIEGILSAIREQANRLELQWGLGAKTRTQVDGFKNTIKGLDSKLGASRFVKTALPPLWAGPGTSALFK